MKKKINILERMYNSPAPQWLRVVRDLWSGLGTGMITYLSVFDFPEHTFNIFSATIIFVGSVLTVFCVVLGKGDANTELQETQDDLEQANQIIKENGENN
jgi:hypothetical protein